MIAYLHDLADIFTKLCKCFNSTIWQGVSAVFFIIVMIVWCVTRIVALPVMIHFLFTDCIWPAPYDQFQPFIYLNGVFLSVMCALHYFWFALFWKMLYRFATEGKAEDIHNKVDNRAANKSDA